MKIPIVGYMSVWNEAEYIEYSIRSVINHVDAFVVIEGAFQETIDTGGSPRSDDGTIEILKKLSKEFFPKLKVAESLPNLSQLKHRSFIFDLIPFHFPITVIANNDYWLWLVDGDEVYDLQNVEKLKKILGATKADAIKIDSFTFVNNFRNYVKIAFPRCFRIHAEQEYFFSGPNHLMSTLRESKKARTWTQVGPEENHEDFVRFFHYSYCKSADRFTQKKKEREHVHGQFKWYLDENERVVSPGVNIRTFSGEHPEVMRGHPKH